MFHLEKRAEGFAGGTGPGLRTGVISVGLHPGRAEGGAKLRCRRGTENHLEEGEEGLPILSCGHVCRVGPNEHQQPRRDPVRKPLPCVIFSKGC